MPSLTLSRSHAPASTPPVRHVPHGPAVSSSRGMPRYLQHHPVKVSQSGDASEQHAERLAARVMSPEPQSFFGRRQPCATDSETVARAAAAPTAAAAPAPSLNGGTPLNHQARAFFEPRFGRDLGGVRVHADEEAGSLARAYSARAFAVGSDIVFAPGEYAPHTEPGRKLLAHELAHVVDPAGQDTLARVPDAGAPALPADAAAAAAAGGTPAVGAPAVPAAPPGGSPFDALFDPCTTPEEAARRDRFALRTFSLRRNIPSTTFGLFDADYFPMAGLMIATVKIRFQFANADNTPSMWRLIRMATAGVDIRKFFWTDTEKEAFKQDYISRVSTRWSFQHSMVSTKPCWRFNAFPLVTPAEVGTSAAAHYVVTVHKSPGGIDYKSGTNDPNTARPDLPATADLWSSDVRESPNFNSQSVATSERQRVEAALAAAAATPVQFDKDKAILKPGARTALTAFANALKQKNPSDPAIPINIDAFASAEGDPARNTKLSDDRAAAVRDFLLALAVPNPIATTSHGAVGAPDDAANRRVDIAIDHAFELTYAANRYSVGEHEFGHMLGLPDEYQNNTTGLLGTQQALYMGLVTAAGAQGPAQWGVNTSSQMSAGVDVLPRHYVTLWEALGRMTTPDITQAQWSLQ